MIFLISKKQLRIFQGWWDFLVFSRGFRLCEFATSADLDSLFQIIGILKWDVVF